MVRVYGTVFSFEVWNKFSNHLTLNGMKSTLLTALRYWFRRPLELVINLSGLTLGIGVALIIFLFVHQEKSFDRFHTHAEDIYRLVTINPQMGNPSLNAPGVMWDPLLSVSEYQQMLRIWTMPRPVEYEHTLLQQNLCFADTGFFEMFDFPLLQGSSKALEEPFTVILTESAAQRYFGDENPVGKQIRVENEYEATVRGVMKDVPANSHLQFDLLVSMETVKNTRPWVFTNINVQSLDYYFRLPTGGDPDHLRLALDDKLQELLGENTKVRTRLQPLLDVRLNSEGLNGEYVYTRDPRVINVIQLIGFLILLIALFNYVNLSMAVILTRFREARIRKINGANSVRLIRQHLIETALICSFCAWLAFILIEICLPLFNQQFNAAISFPVWWQTLLIFLALVALISLISGIYPAFLFSREAGLQNDGNTEQAFGSQKGWRRLTIRDVLVSIQFFIAASLIAGFVVINRQFHFLTETNLGFSTEQILVVENPWDGNMDKRYDVFSAELSRIPGVKQVSAGHNIPGAMLNNMTRARYRTGEDGVLSYVISVEPGYFELLDMPVVEGNRDLLRGENDSITGVLINEKLRDMLEIDDPVGKRISGVYSAKDAPILGVVKNAHYGSKVDDFEPMLFQSTKKVYPAYTNNILIKIEGQAAVQEVLEKLEELFAEHAAGYVMHYSFLDEQVQALYENQKQLKVFINVFTLLALIISAMGLLGISMHTFARSRRKISIHKVQGATPGDVIRLLASRYLIMSVLAVAVSVPLTRFALSAWLSGFRFRIDYPWYGHLISLLFVLLLTLLTLFYVIRKALRQNPAEVLRTE